MHSASAKPQTSSLARTPLFVVCLPQPFGPESIAAIAAMSFIGSGSFGNQLVRNF